MRGGWRGFPVRLDGRPGRASRREVRAAVCGILIVGLAFVLLGFTPTRARPSPSPRCPSRRCPSPTVSVADGVHADRLGRRRCPTPTVSTPSLPTPTVPTVSVPKPTPPPVHVPTVTTPPFLRRTRRRRLRMHRRARDRRLEANRPMEALVHRHRAGHRRVLRHLVQAPRPRRMERVRPRSQRAAVVPPATAARRGRGALRDGTGHGGSAFGDGGGRPGRLLSQRQLRRSCQITRVASRRSPP